MAQPVHTSKSCSSKLIFVALQLLPIVKVCRNQAGITRKRSNFVQHRPLEQCSNRDASGLAAFCPGSFQFDSVPLVGDSSDELDCFFSTQPECSLQAKTLTDMLVCDFFEIGRWQVAAFAFLGDIGTPSDAQLIISDPRNPAAAGFFECPAQMTHPVF
ncbi:hypothetical protein D3C71_1399510 [compost metagenome]